MKTEVPTVHKAFLQRPWHLNIWLPVFFSSKGFKCLKFYFCADSTADLDCLLPKSFWDPEIKCSCWLALVQTSLTPIIGSEFSTKCGLWHTNHKDSVGTRKGNVEKLESWLLRINLKIARARGRGRRLSRGVKQWEKHWKVKSSVEEPADLWRGQKAERLCRA